MCSSSLQAPRRSNFHASRPTRFSPETAQAEKEAEAFVKFAPTSSGTFLLATLIQYIEEANKIEKTSTKTKNRRSPKTKK